jgi:uncharacterized protein YecE (DUF72 family)
VKSEVRIGISGWNYAGWRGVFVYFDNDAKVHAPFDAQTLVRKMK